jgi:phage I-like protein
MEEKDFRKLLTDQTEEINRHGEMLLEEFQSQLKVIAEVQVDHSHKLDALLEMVANNTENIELIKSMLKRKVDIEEFEALTKRVMILEKKLLPLK